MLSSGWVRRWRWRCGKKRGEDGADVVYRLNFSEETTFSASVVGANAKVALYAANFNGKGGPHVNNYYGADPEEDEDDDDDEVITEYHNPERAVYTIYNCATNSLLREPTEDYPWSMISVQNGVPQLSVANVTENSFTITTYDADSWTEVDSFTIYKD